MADLPRRVQRSRAKGWRMPDGAVYVGRPTVFGNPFTVAACREAGIRGTEGEHVSLCVQAFREWIGGSDCWWMGPEADAARDGLRRRLPELRGHDLACWCRLDQPCHADVLLRLANPICEEAGDG
ncbi:MAG: DUF4326 domain-containing protein [Ancalomicrobiaceae bacterium]|nr:DUF4326 domain-containing protein [Ancalomicrobiaceae bacterium]